MATLQIRIEGNLKKEADALFTSLGLDTSTAVRIFLNAAIEYNGIPFAVQHKVAGIKTCDTMTDAEVDNMLRAGLNQAKAGEAIPIEQAFANPIQGL